MDEYVEVVERTHFDIKTGTPAVDYLIAARDKNTVFTVAYTDYGAHYFKETWPITNLDLQTDVKRVIELLIVRYQSLQRFESGN